MGLKWRKSMSVGPIRANVSNSGVGWSINLGLCRLGLNAQGRLYFSAGIRGQGCITRQILMMRANLRNSYCVS